MQAPGNFCGWLIFTLAFFATGIVPAQKMVGQDAKIGMESPGLASHKELTCFKASDSVVVNGGLSKEAWKNGIPIVIADDLAHQENRATVRTLWDATNLYILFEVEDRNLVSKQTVQDHPQLFLDDMVEFLIDANNEKDSCWDQNDVVYHFNLLGQKKDDRGTLQCVSDASWDGNAISALQLIGTLNDSSDVDSGFAVEISVRWEELHIKPAPGLHIGVNFAIGNNGRLFDWAGAFPFRSPYAFGDLILAKRKE